MLEGLFGQYRDFKYLESGYLGVFPFDTPDENHPRGARVGLKDLRKILEGNFATISLEEIDID